MKSNFSRLALCAVALCLMEVSNAGAQQLPPIEAPQPLPATHADTPTLHMTTTEVLVPTLVEKHGGGILYGLKPGDFVLEDNGVPQTIRVRRRWTRRQFHWWWP